MPIPIRRLPLLVLDEVIKNLGFPQLFLLSLCSKRMNLVVKNLRDKSIKLTMRLTVGEKIDIFLKEENTWNTLFSVAVQAKSEEKQKGWRDGKFEGTRFNSYALGLRSYVDDVEVGIKSLLEHMSDLFCAPVNELRIEELRFFWMFDWIEKRQGPGSYQAYIGYESNGLNDGKFRRLLVDLKPSTLYVITQSDQVLVINSQENLQEITWANRDWLTIENMLTIDCNRLTVDEATFTVTEINQFLRRVLIDGGAPKLAYFVGRLENNQESKRALDGVQEVLTPIHGKQQFKDNGDSWEFSGILNREDRTAFVSIECFGIGKPFIRFQRTGARLTISPQ